MYKYIALWRLAYKNTYRNPARLQILVSVWCFGTLAIVLASSFVKGLVHQRIAERINVSLGHAKITHQAYNYEKNAVSCLNLTHFLDKNIFQTEKIKSYTTRLNVRGLCYPKKKDFLKHKNFHTNTHKNISPKNNIVDIYGIYPHTDKAVFDLHKKIIFGNFLTEKLQENEGENEKKNEIIIGNDFAKTQNIALFDTLVIEYFSKQKNLIKRPYIVVGIFQTQNQVFDKTHIFTHKDTWRGFDKDDFHQLIFKLEDYQKAFSWVKNQKKDLKNMYPNQKINLKSWQEVSPDLGFLYEMMRVFFEVFLWLILGVSVMGLVQVFVVMTHERQQEYQKMQDLGLQRRDIMLLCGFEGFIFYLRALPYSVLGVIFLFIFGQYWGINLSIFGEAMRSWGNAEVVFLVLDFWEILRLFLVQCVVSFLVFYLVSFFLNKNKIAFFS